MSSLRDRESDDPLAELVTPASPGGAIAPTSLGSDGEPASAGSGAGGEGDGGSTTAGSGSADGGGGRGDAAGDPTEASPAESGDSEPTQLDEPEPRPADGVAPPVPAGRPEPQHVDAARSGARPVDPVDPDDPELAVFPRSYVPPPSPAYAPPPAAPVAARPAAPPPLPPAAPTATSATHPSHRAGWRLLVAGVSLVAIAGGIVVIQGGDPTAPDRYVFGTVTAASPGVTVRTGATDATEERSLAPGDAVTAGAVIETEGGASAAIGLAGGGLVRFDSGARLAFVDLAGDPQTGATSGGAEPAIQVEGGRVWLNPADGPQPFEVQVAGGTMKTTGNPVALDCDPVCTVEAPAGGVTVATRTNSQATPAPGEILAITSANGFEVTFADGRSEWASENLAADEDAGQPEPSVDDAPGIRASAVFGGTYAVNLEVVGEPTGADIPVPLRYPLGSAYTVTVLADSTTCDAPPCTVPISGLDGGDGSAEVADGAVALTFSQDIDCFDETDTAVVRPGIGTTMVETTFHVEDVAFEGGRFMVSRLSGEGTVSATLTTACNPADVLGTSTSPVEVSGTNG